MTLEKILDMWLNAVITEKKMGVKISIANAFRFFILMIIKNKK